MENGIVAEVRGVESGQNLEGCMTGIVAEKLKTLPGGDVYFKKVENMKQLTEIDERVNAGGELTVADTVFLCFSGWIEGFGEGEDPRVDKLLAGRNYKNDLSMVLASVDPTTFANALIEQGSEAYLVAHGPNTFLAAGVDAEYLNELLRTH